MIDIIIIGSGPAGLSAAINAAARNVAPVILGRKKDTSGLFKAESINNHLGMPNMTGENMMDAFFSHAKSLDVEIREGRVLQAVSAGNRFMINFDNEFLEAKSLILTTGINKKSGAKGESELLGKGVSYCATCDGMLYRSKTVIVAGEIAEAEEDANFLSEICSKVYYVHSYDGQPKVTAGVVVIKGKVTEVFGEDYVTGAEIGGENIPCDGVFFIKESTPASTLLPGIETDGGAIKVNRYMETNIDGVYAAGDCTGWPYQISKAIGDGLIAAQQCVRRLKKA
jgi:thioredoxin reductase (NADPH)